MSKDIRYVYNETYKSPYETDKLIREYGKLKFYFSTSSGLERFDKHLETNINKINHWVSIYIGDNFIVKNLINYLYTYVNVEKRGFRVELEVDGKLEVFKCKEEMVEMLNSIYSKELD